MKNIIKNFYWGILMVLWLMIYLGSFFVYHHCTGNKFPIETALLSMPITFFLGFKTGKQLQNKI